MVKLIATARAGGRNLPTKTAYFNPGHLQMVCAGGE